MIPNQRRDKIIEYLQGEEARSIAELSKALGVSEATIHRDLKILENAGVLMKVHGGAVLRKGNRAEPRINVRLGRNIEEKREIAKKAVQLINEETSIFLDHSSTSVFLARELISRNYQHLILVTNSVEVLNELEGHYPLHIISTGGMLQHQWSALTGAYALNFISKLHFDQIFVSCAGISIERGLMTFFSFVSEIVRKTSEVTDQVNVLVDSSKFLKTGLFSIMPISSVNRIITDRKLDPKLAEKYREFDIDFIT